MNRRHRLNIEERKRKPGDHGRAEPAGVANQPGTEPDTFPHKQSNRIEKEYHAQPQEDSGGSQGKRCGQTSISSETVAAEADCEPAKSKRMPFR